MKIKKYQKSLVTICITLVFLIAVILLATDLPLFNSKKEDKPYDLIADHPQVTNIAVIVNDQCSDMKVNLLKESLDSISDEYEKTYDLFYVKDYSNSYENTISAATTDGAGLVICPDSSFEEVVYDIQNTYVSTTFLIIDGIPHNSDNSDTTVNFNVIPLIHDDAEAGFLAGYAAVYDGNKKIAFMGLADDTSSAHYCYGFLQGADCAATELNYDNLLVTYTYVEKEEAKNTAEEFYKNDTDIVIACNNKIIDEVLSVSEEYEMPMIACGDDYSSDLSKSIVASTNKNTYISTYDCLSKFYSNTISGGSIQKYSVSNNAITLDFKSEDFGHFDSNIYDSIYMKLANAEIQIISDTTVPVTDLELAKIEPIFKERKLQNNIK